MILAYVSHSINQERHSEGAGNEPNLKLLCRPFGVIMEIPRARGLDPTVRHFEGRVREDIQIEVLDKPMCLQDLHCRQRPRPTVLIWHCTPAWDWNTLEQRSDLVGWDVVWHLSNHDPPNHPTTAKRVDVGFALKPPITVRISVNPVGFYL